MRRFHSTCVSLWLECQHHNNRSVSSVIIFDSHFFVWICIWTNSVSLRPSIYLGLRLPSALWLGGCSRISLPPVRHLWVPWSAPARIPILQHKGPSFVKLYKAMESLQKPHPRIRQPLFRYSVFNFTDRYHHRNNINIPPHPWIRNHLTEQRSKLD